MSRPETGFPRIASLVPSATELLVALGLRPWLVARTGFCTQPREAVRDIPKVGGTKDVNLARLAALAPTHVVLNVDENRRETAEALADQGWRLIVTHPQGPGDVPALIEQLAAPFADLPGVADRAAALQAALAVALDTPTPAGPAPAVLYLIWREPWMAVARDTYIARLLQAGGWRSLPAVEGGPQGAARYPALAADDPVWQQADEVWLSSEPYAFQAHHRAEVQALAPQARVRLVDGELCSWWGARTAAGLAYVRSLRA
jgi:ABC-type Fe3+-hydroxamate transport system substrate-binding protein